MLTPLLLLVVLIHSAVGNEAICGPSSLKGDSGQLKSHSDYGNSDYPNNLDCQWVIEVSQNKSVRLTFVDFDLEASSACRYDYLDIYDGDKLTDNRLRRSCGAVKPTPVETTGRFAALRFKTDATINKKGFLLRWEAVVPPIVCKDNEFTCRNEKCVPRSSRCNGRDDCGDGSDEAQCNATCGYNIIPTYGGNGYIVGGRNARPGSWPWQAQMLRYNTHYCGGTLVDNRWIVTAAHCVVRETSPAQYRIGLGSHTKARTDPNQINYEVEKIIRHPMYNSRSFDYDIALMKLKKNVTFNDYVFPACMSAESFAPDTFCYTTGWGATQNTGYDDILKQAYVPLWANARCNLKQHYNNVISERMVCAGYETGGHDACQGDSGGPLVCARGKGNDALWYLAGATSWGQGCARPNKPGVYADVPNLYNWLKDEMAKN